MRSVVMTMLMLLAAGSALGGEPQSLDELFAGWERDRDRTTSLIIEFDRTFSDRTFDTKTTYSGTLRLLRTADGQIYGSYEETQQVPAEKKARRASWLLVHEDLYQLDHDEKAWDRMTVPQKELPQFLEMWLNPFIVFLDRQRAEKKYEIKIKGERYGCTHLVIRLMNPQKLGWTWDSVPTGQALLMNEDSKTIPKGMPSYLRLELADGDTNLFKIESWKINPEAPPTLEEFTRPEDRPGWKPLVSQRTSSTPRMSVFELTFPAYFWALSAPLPVTEIAALTPELTAFTTGRMIRALLDGLTSEADPSNSPSRVSPADEPGTGATPDEKN